MKIRIEVEDGRQESEVVIKCARVDDSIQKIHQYILDQAAGVVAIAFFKQDREYYFPVSEILFFETEGDLVYAHTAQDSYRIKHRLYELEDLLPGQFMRAAKSLILNTDKIHSITRNMASASLVEFPGTHKKVYVSRRYFTQVKERLEERRNVR